MRLRAGDDLVRYTTLIVLRELARRARNLRDETNRLNKLLRPLVRDVAPELLEIHGVGLDTAAKLLVAAGDNPERLHSEAAWAHLCGVAPIPASSGKTVRHRLNRGGNRQANSAIYTVMLTRMRNHQPTRDYIAKRSSEGKTMGEIARMLRRYIAREVFPSPTAPHITPKRSTSVWPHEPAHAPMGCAMNDLPTEPERPATVLRPGLAGVTYDAPVLGE